MPTNFPTSVDNFTNPTANDSLNLPSHSTQHANANDAIEAVEDYLLNGNGRAGFAHLNTTSFSASSGVNINNVFSATYQAYKIVLSNMSCGSSSQNIFMRLRVSGVNAASNYFESGYVSYIPGSVLAFAGNSAVAEVILSTVNATHRAGSVTELQNPALAVATTMQNQRNYYDGSNLYGVGLSMIHTTATAYDGFTIYPGASTMTGTVSVFGYRNS